MPPVLQVAFFIQFYGPEAYRSHQYPTSDKIIPYKLFNLMYKASRHVMAMHRLTDARAVAHGTAMVQDGKNPAIKKLLNAELDEAFGVED